MTKARKQARLPKMTANARVYAYIGVLVVLIAVLVGYNRYSVRSAQDIDMVDELSGQRIGTILAWESDYLLTDRDDLTLMRYETLADCILALSYHQIDAIGMDLSNYGASMQVLGGMEVVGDPLTTMGGTLVMANSTAENGILDEFNQYAANFRQSDFYEEFMNRILFTDDAVECDADDVPEVENGKPLNVCFVPEYYPWSYLETKNGNPKGFAVEIVKRFAYEYGYTIHFTEESTTGMYIGLYNGSYDMAAVNMTDTYRKDVESGGYALMSDSYYDLDVCMIHLKDNEKIVMDAVDFK